MEILNLEMEEKQKIYELIEEAKRLIPLNPAAAQVIAVQTSKSNIYGFANHICDSVQYDKESGRLITTYNGRTEDEDGFVQMLSEKGDCEVKYIVCMWTNHSTEIPSMNFRKSLLGASAQNTEAMIVYETQLGLRFRKLGSSI